MKNSDLVNKLNRLFKLKELIDGKVKKIYEEHNQLTVECVEEICRRKGGDHADGILKANLKVKLGSDVYEVIPNYMKDGMLKNVMWKPAGVHAFSINKINKGEKVDE